MCVWGVGGRWLRHRRAKNDEQDKESQGNYGGQEERTVGKGESREGVRQGHVGPDGNFRMHTR